MTNGIAIFITSIGNSNILSPFRLNINTMVNSKAYNVTGDILGANFLLYHSTPFDLTRVYRLTKPATKGIPKYINTLSVTSFIDTLTLKLANPNLLGNTFIKSQTKKL